MAILLLRILARPALQSNAKAYFSRSYDRIKRHSSGIKTHRRRPSQKNWPNTFNHPSSTFRVLETKFVPLKFYKRKPEIFNILRQILRLRLYHRRKSCKKNTATALAYLNFLTFALDVWTSLAITFTCEFASNVWTRLYDIFSHPLCTYNNYYHCHHYFSIDPRCSLRRNNG